MLSGTSRTCRWTQWRISQQSKLFFLSSWERTEQSWKRSIWLTFVRWTENTTPNACWWCVSCPQVAKKKKKNWLWVDEFDSVTQTYAATYGLCPHHCKALTACLVCSGEVFSPKHFCTKEWSHSICGINHLLKKKTKNHFVVQKLFLVPSKHNVTQYINSLVVQSVCIHLPYLTALLGLPAAEYEGRMKRRRCNPVAAFIVSQCFSTIWAWTLE